MSTGETCKDRQINEINVLKSIYGNEFKDIRKNKNKKKWQPIDIIMTLKPQVGSSGGFVEAHAQIDLHVTCGEKYPEEVPKIQLKNSRGLSDQQVAKHLIELEELAKKLKGEVMIFDLAQFVKKFLDENNKPGYSSCYDEMVSKMEEKKQSELQEKQKKEDKERQVFQDEILKRKEALKEEYKYRRESLRMTQSLDNDHILPASISSSPLERARTYSRRRCMSSSDSSDIYVCEHKGIKVLRFHNHKYDRQVHRGNCLGHSVKGSVVYSGVDLNTGELFAVTEWTLECTKSSENKNTESTNIQNTIKQLASIEQELNHLQKLIHPNLVHYLSLMYTQDGNKITVHVLQEFVVGTTCSIFLSENIPVDIDLLRFLATGILTALKYLHENNVVHKDLRDSSVYITSKGIVKLSDYSLDKRLSDMFQQNAIAKAEQDFPTVQGRGGKKADIYRFGILLLSLYNGSIVSDKEVENISSLNTISDKPDLKDFISKCILCNERSRWSADQLLEHCFIHTPLDRGFSPLKLNHNENKRIQPEQEPDSDVQFHFPAYGGGQSRIHNEFEVLKWLGKGAFGDVLKVKNKLDGGIYAIKRIKLNPKNKQLNKKITREVKLLSRLNHENVVRYYNSWIESAKIDDPDRHSRFTPCTTSSARPASDISQNCSNNDDLDNMNIEKLASPLHDVEWNISYKSRLSTAVSEDSEEDNSEHSSDSESDEEWSFIMKTAIDNVDSSDGIEFAKDGPSSALSVKENSQFQNDSDSKNEDEKILPLLKEIQFMYIQMEFCEKSTLRTAIDSGLYKDEERIWRLFREITEGLVHIHQQGMIHRDLKPVNIFLDSNDHVKIGDFGLATSNILSSLNQQIDSEKETQSVSKIASLELEELNSMTGQVGTALYAAPELSAKAAQAFYNQKVDIYSLGIIFFEMCYRSVSTGMERVKILLNLRSKEIILPPDMKEIEMPHKISLIKCLLNHDPSQRPTSQELLASEHLPPLRVEESELQGVIRRTLSDPKSKAYRCLIDCCFKQEATTVEDVTYDMNLPTRNANKNIFTPKNQSLQENIKSKVIDIFRRHGGICIATPLLKLKSGTFYNFTDSCVQMMTRNGNIVFLPHDLRVPFARYVAWNNISNIRRYAIERVYRERKVHGFHPRELYECAFDIISSKPNNFMAEAELIFITWEIFKEIPESYLRDIEIRINHTSLLRAVLEYCGVEKERYNDIYSILRDAIDGKFSKFQLHTHLFSLCLKDQSMETLYNLLDTENSATKIISVLKTISRRKGDVGDLAKEGLQEIETFMAHVHDLGVTWPITIVPVLVHNIQQYNGIIFQVTCKLKRRRKIGQDVIAAGGRYDNMISSFRKIFERTGIINKDIKQYGVGLSISLEKLVCAAKEFSENVEDNDDLIMKVAVCCLDEEPKKGKELAEVLKELWALNLCVTCLDFQKIEEVLEYCRENDINNIVIVKTGEKDYLRIQTWEKDKFLERKVSIKDLTEYFHKQNDNSINLNKSDTKISANNEYSISTNSILTNVNVNFIFSDKDRLSNSNKRIFKNSVFSQMSSYLQRISCKVDVEVFAVFLEISVVRTIANYLEIDEDESDFRKSIQLVIEKHPRHKKYLKEICDQMWETRNKRDAKCRPALSLYSLIDSRYVTIL